MKKTSSEAAQNVDLPSLSFDTFSSSCLFSLDLAPVKKTGAWIHFTVSQWAVGDTVGERSHGFVSKIKWKQFTAFLSPHYTQFNNKPLLPKEVRLYWNHYKAHVPQSKWLFLYFRTRLLVTRIFRVIFFVLTGISTFTLRAQSTWAPPLTWQ